MAIETFNRKRSIFCGSLEKELREETSEVLCVKCSVLWCRDLHTTTGRAKTTGSIWDVDMEKDEAFKMDRQNKNAIVLEKVAERRIMLEIIKKRKRNWLGHWLRRNCLLKDALGGMVNGKKVRRRRRYKIIDNIMINGLYADTKRKAEKRIECRMLSLQWKTYLIDWVVDWSIDRLNFMMTG